MNGSTAQTLLLFDTNLFGLISYPLESFPKSSRLSYSLAFVCLSLFHRAVGNCQSRRTPLLLLSMQDFMFSLFISMSQDTNKYVTYSHHILQAGRPAGGVAILLPLNMGAKIVRRLVQDELNALWVRIPNSVDIVAFYVRPGAEREAFRCFMEEV